MLASTIGTTIERYDFLLYGTVTGLVFGKVFFPGSSPLIGVLQAFGVFFIGFVGRPIGAAIFGHFGDRIGRKATLIATLLITGFATIAVGLVPGYASIGIWGAVLLTFIRLVQGIGVGGEWGGSVLLAMEWARTSKHRGFIASWPQFGAPAGFFLANSAVLIFSWLSGDQFLVWGWRLPFLISIVMVAVGLWIRLGILETPVFRKILEEERIESDRSSVLCLQTKYSFPPPCGCPSRCSYLFFSLLFPPRSTACPLPPSSLLPYLSRPRAPLCAPLSPSLMAEILLFFSSRRSSRRPCSPGFTQVCRSQFIS